MRNRFGFRGVYQDRRQVALAPLRLRMKNWTIAELENEIGRLRSRPSSSGRTRELRYFEHELSFRKRKD